MNLFCNKCHKKVAVLSGKMLPGAKITATCKECKGELPDAFNKVFDKFRRG